MTINPLLHKGSITILSAMQPLHNKQPKQKHPKPFWQLFLLFLGIVATVVVYIRNNTTNGNQQEHGIGDTIQKSPKLPTDPEAEKVQKEQRLQQLEDKIRSGDSLNEVERDEFCTLLWEVRQISIRDCQNLGSHSVYLDWTKVVRDLNFGKQIHEGKQGKHIEGHNNFQLGKSIMTSDPQSLLNSFHKLQFKDFQIINKQKIRVTFEEVVGKYNSPTGNLQETNNVIIVNSRTGVHMYPARP